MLMTDSRQSPGYVQGSPSPLHALHPLSTNPYHFPSVLCTTRFCSHSLLRITSGNEVPSLPQPPLWLLLLCHINQRTSFHLVTLWQEVGSMVHGSTSWFLCCFPLQSITVILIELQEHTECLVQLLPKGHDQLYKQRSEFNLFTPNLGKIKIPLIVLLYWFVFLFLFVFWFFFCLVQSTFSRSHLKACSITCTSGMGVIIVYMPFYPFRTRSNVFVHYSSLILGFYVVHFQKGNMTFIDFQKGNMTFPLKGTF